ncbi:MAG: DUF512 domain-containing protein [Candidatus Cloacimonetes bacterium]|nr:DUF512 domain-containing protein [Candidatus Cloacimonadota bacterium]
MSVKIQNIQKNSIAASLPIKKSHTIVSIDNEPVFDILDIMYYTQKNRFTVQYKDDSEKNQSCKVINNFDKPLGYEVELPECETCINNCIFCFVDQMPTGLRKSLYVKDDDFIYSFFYGNFITLTNLTKKNIDKIVKQHLSPLYVSVHTTDPELHKQILCYEIDFNIMESLKMLEQAGIWLHVQIVLIPDVNDKDFLTKCLLDLIRFENVLSIGIVPIGLTKHRENLKVLRKISKEEAESVINQVEQSQNVTENGMYIYCADEIFIKAEKAIPSDEYYGDYAQIENGIGMIRKSHENWKRLKKKYFKLFDNKEGNAVFVTSISGYYAIEPIVKELQKNLINKNVRISVIKNNFFGEEVTVTGLLTWQDIKTQIDLSDNEYPIFSSGIFNYEMLSIDNVPMTEIKSQIGREIIVIDELFSQWTIVK